MDKKEHGATAKVDVSKAAVEKFATKVLNDRLADVQSKAAEVQPSAQLVAQIEKRVPPGALAGYTNLSGATELLAMEIDSVGSRINRYRYLAQYGNHFKSPSPEIGMAFTAHLHDLRPVELYIIQERGTEALRFASIIAAELGYKAGSRAVAFSKAFKKRLEKTTRKASRHPCP